MRWPLTFILLFACDSATAQVKITKHENEVSIEIERQSAIHFFYGPDVTKPYLYPLQSALGVIVTRRWPMNPQTGERHDHIHHRGVWFAHSDVNGIDFWNSDPSYRNDRMGHITLSKIDKVTSGQQRGSITAELDWLEPSGNELLHETRTMTFYSGEPRIIDFDFNLTAREQVKFGDEKDGVFGLRLAPELEEPTKDAPSQPARSGVMTSSNGCHQEVECWGRRADWIDVSGKIRDSLVGVSIFDHPGNPRHPTYWHVRGYGLLAANIFGVKAFTKDPPADGTLTLEPGADLRFRYRVLIHAGDAQATDLRSLYRDYVQAGSSGKLR